MGVASLIVALLVGRGGERHESPERRPALAVQPVSDRSVGPGDGAASRPAVAVPAAPSPTSTPPVTARAARRPARSGPVEVAAPPRQQTPAAVTTVAPPAPASSPSPPPAATCQGTPTRIVPVTDAVSLRTALLAAAPGDRIQLADGTYSGHFSTSTSGTDAQRIQLCGGSGAILDGGSTLTGYVLHHQASRWDLVGFTVRNGQKGVMLDGASSNLIAGLTVQQVGDEGIHLRSASSSNRIVGATVTDTGLRDARFGEGVYVGSAVNNWCLVSACGPDRSDDNTIESSRFSRTAAEAVDVKEGTTGGRIRGNEIDGSGSTADSWIDVKGNGWQVTANRGRTSAHDGFLTEVAVDGWGGGNTFSGNVGDLVGGSGYGFRVQPGNAVRCDNAVTGAAKGLSNVPCT